MKTIRNYQIQMLETDMEDLKRRTGKKATKEALETAVGHYLVCDRVKEE